MTTFTAELGSNHNGDYVRAVALVDAAHACGCAAVKLQFFTKEKLFAPGFGSDRMHEVPLAWLPLLAGHAHALGMKFGCSVFDPNGARAAAAHCDFLKVSSYSVLDWRLLDAVRATRRPAVLSTGMSTDDEIYHAMKYLGGPKDGFVLLHCVSKYPTESEECNLSRIRALRQIYSFSFIGYSDHSANVAVALAAALRYDAYEIEVHLDLEDDEGQESSQGHCWTPSRLRPVIDLLRTAETAQREIIQADIDERRWRADPSDGLRPMREFRK